MKLNLSPFSVLLICFLLSCSRQPQRADPALAKDFDGRWSGKWSWNVTNSASVEISGTRAIVAGLPIVRDPVAGTLFTVQTEGTVTFESAYGAKGAPCVLLSFPGVQEIVAIFLSKDRESLIYDVDVNHEWRIIFTRSIP